MNQASKRLLTALLCSGLLAAGGSAHADRGDNRYWSDHDRHSYRYDRDRREHRHGDSRTVIRERVVIREVPRRYREREVREYYYTPPRSYGYRTEPAVVIGFNIPPIVIPLR